jgi:hypothetical protein
VRTSVACECTGRQNELRRRLLDGTEGTQSARFVLETSSMANTNLAELRFFLDDRDDVAARVYRTGASTTEVMKAVGLHEAHRDTEIVTRTTTEHRIANVCAILTEADEEEIELSIDDVEYVD